MMTLRMSPERLLLLEFLESCLTGIHLGHPDLWVHDVVTSGCPGGALVYRSIMPVRRIFLCSSMTP
jgi:hypothetical protein